MKFIIFYYLYCSFTSIRSTWVPESQYKLEPNDDQFHPYSWRIKEPNWTPDISEFISEYYISSVASLALLDTKYVSIIYGLTKLADNETKSAYRTENSIVVICQLSLLKKESVSCSKFLAGNTTYLGESVKSYRISSKEGVVIFCDPLWHNRLEREPKPGGKCFIRHVDKSNNINDSHIEFCKFSSTSFQNCMGGFSIDVSSTNDFSSGVQVIVGMPYKLPYGGVSILSNLFGKNIQETVPRSGEGRYFNFGYSVALTKSGNAYASSPISDQYGPNVTEVKTGEIKLVSPDKVPFSSFGTSLETLKLKSGRTAVVVGAPYHSRGNDPNVGKVYVFCVDEGGQRTNLGASIHGDESSEYLGYQVSNLGDVDGDGNDDLVVTSPFLRDTNKTRVTLYTVDGDCQISKMQTLRTPQFITALATSSDLDFNTWPDLIVATSQPPSIQIYTARPRYTPKCMFKFSSNFMTSTLMKGTTFSGSITIFLYDPRRSEPVDLEFLSQFSLMPQINLNFNRSDQYFKLFDNKIDQFISDSFISVRFKVQANVSAKSIDLTQPIKFVYRIINNCNSPNKCDYTYFPLIDWSSKCSTIVEINKFFCAFNKPCNADLNLKLTDQSENVVYFNYKGTYSRKLELVVENLGPTEAFDIRIHLRMIGKLRVRGHELENGSSIRLDELSAQNDTVRLYEMRDVEMGVNQIFRMTLNVYFDNTLSDGDYGNNSVVAKLISGVRDDNKTNNEARVSYRFVYAPNITIRAKANPETIVDHRNRSSYIGYGTRVGIEQVGPRYSVSFTVRNEGPTKIDSFNMVLNVPLYPRNQPDVNILYLFSRIRGGMIKLSWINVLPRVRVTGYNDTICELDHTMINQRDLIVYETHDAHLIEIDSNVTSRVLKRQKRSASSQRSFKKKNKQKMDRLFTEIIQCNRAGMTLARPVCLKIMCRNIELPVNKQAKLQFNAWLWSRTFFMHLLSDSMVYTTLQVELDKKLPSDVQYKAPLITELSQSQRIVFPKIRSTIQHLRLIWPIIVGVVVGILLLAIIIVAMYKCGFFRRSKRGRGGSTRSFRPASGNYSNAAFISSQQRSGHYNPTIVHQHDMYTPN